MSKGLTHLYLAFSTSVASEGGMPSISTMLHLRHCYSVRDLSITLLRDDHMLLAITESLASIQQQDTKGVEEANPRNLTSLCPKMRGALGNLNPNPDALVRL